MITGLDPAGGQKPRLPRRSEDRIAPLLLQKSRAAGGADRAIENVMERQGRRDPRRGILFLFLMNFRIATFISPTAFPRRRR